MQCPKCDTTYQEGTLLCARCGAALDAVPSTDGKPTGPLPGPVVSSSPGVLPAALPDDLAQIPPGSFALWVASSSRRQIFGMGKEVLIGRLDSARWILPDLELTADGGVEKGVSRQHCRITFRDGLPYVEDLESTNRTYLNNLRLAPRAPYPLHHGDELRLGVLMLRVELPWLEADREA